VNFEVSSCTKFQIFRGSAPDPAGVANSAPPDPLAGGGPHPPLSALRASSFGILGRSFAPPQISHQISASNVECASLSTLHL